MIYKGHGDYMKVMLGPVGSWRVHGLHEGYMKVRLSSRSVTQFRIHKDHNLMEGL